VDTPAPTRPPVDIDELMTRAVAISGWRIADVADWVRSGSRRGSGFGKGWAGNVVEMALGATAGSQQGPDFPELGVEVKTIPVREDGKPLESTWVTTVELLHANALTWQTSHVRAKLSCVLWIPLLAAAGQPLEDRRVGGPLLWRPDEEQEAALRADWEDLMELVVLGRSDEISARMGNVLQMRPKGARATSRVIGVDADGELAPVAPRGFYLRPGFTRQILDRGFGIA